MFEDIYEVSPDLKKAIKDSVLKSMEDAALQIAHEDEEVQKAVKLYRKYIEEQLDDIVQMYQDSFTLDELTVVLDWTESDLGKKTTKFTGEKLMPIVLGTLERVATQMIDDDFAKDDEYFKQIDDRLAEQTRLQKERMDRITDEWNTDYGNLGADGPVKLAEGCVLPAGPWDESCTLEEDCQCGCEGGDPNEDNCVY